MKGNVNQKPSIACSICLFIFLFSVVFTLYYFEQCRPVERIITDKVYDNWKVRLYCPVLPEDTIKSHGMTPSFLLKSLDELEKDRESGTKYILLIPDRLKKNLIDDLKEISLGNYRDVKISLLSERKNTQIWEISYKVFYLDRAYFRYIVYNDVIIPVSVRRIPRVAITIMLVWSFMLSFAVTLGIRILFTEYRRHPKSQFVKRLW